MLVFFLIFFLINTQKPSAMKNRQKLDSKNKAELIQIALRILKEKEPSLAIDFHDFESTKAIQASYDPMPTPERIEDLDILTEIK